MTYDYTITHKNWNGIEIEIRWNPDYLVYDDQTHMAHLEVMSVKPERAPLPITETGYKSHFIQVSAVDRYDSPEAYVEAWLTHASYDPAWREAQAAKAQLSLF